MLEQLVQGHTYQEIADRLFSSHSTVRKHIENIYRKPHIHSKVEAVNKANEPVVCKKIKLAEVRE